MAVNPLQNPQQLPVPQQIIQRVSIACNQIDATRQSQPFHILFQEQHITPSKSPLRHTQRCARTVHAYEWYVETLQMLEESTRAATNIRNRRERDFSRFSKMFEAVSNGGKERISNQPVVVRGQALVRCDTANPSFIRARCPVISLVHVTSPPMRLFRRP